MNSLEKIFNEKSTENGDISYKSTGNDMLDLLFMSEYYEKHLGEANIKVLHMNEPDEKMRLFAMFIRDPRLGLGRRNLGRNLMFWTRVKPENVPKCGRYDDLLYIGVKDYDYLDVIVSDGLGKGDYLARKWLPRLNTNKELAQFICQHYKISEKKYRKIIKLDTTENLLSRQRTDEIDFEKVPSLAMLKYYKRFITGEDTRERFLEYLSKVEKGEKKLNISTTTVYDIYKNREQIDADLFFDKLEKIKISCIPILDTSGSMWDGNDSIGKATSIAHYLAKCSSYCNGYVISFSSEPQLIQIKEKNNTRKTWGYYKSFGSSNKYSRELNSLYTGDCSNTDFGKVMKILEKLNELPEYLVVLSDMEFDYGSNQSKNELQRLWKEKGYTTKIIWWNFNDRNTTVPEIDEMGNIFISGYNPMLLKYLEAGFNGELFLDKLLKEYHKNLTKQYEDIII